ncbi:MAG: hypothetical protein JXL84_20860 [Deltaproteobacteria bacterium]|nr:hypothetical protein [Deltaproteobacteria bacterium]
MDLGAFTRFSESHAVEFKPNLDVLDIAEVGYTLVTWESHFDNEGGMQ